MFASYHEHPETVKLLLGHPSIDANARNMVSLYKKVVAIDDGIFPLAFNCSAYAFGYVFFFVFLVEKHGSYGCILSWAH